MTRQGRDLERLVAILEEHLGSQGIHVSSPDYILGRESKSRREVDISLRCQVGSSEILVIIECRDRQGREDVTWIEQLASKRKDVGADKAMAVSSSGFTSGAINVAKANDVELRTLKDVNPNEILLWFSFKEVIGLKHSVVFTRITIQISTLDKFNIQTDSLIAVHQSLNVDEQLFYRKQDNSLVSFKDIWWSFSQDDLYVGVIPEKPKVKRQIRLKFPQDELGFQLKTERGLVDIKYIDVDAELWIDVEKQPITNIRLYRNDGEVIAQSAEVSLEHKGKNMIFSLHHYPNTGKQIVSLRSMDDESQVNLRLNAVSLNDVLYNQLKSIAQEQTIVSETGLVSTLNSLLPYADLDNAVINRVATAISREEHKSHRPLLSAVVVSNKTKMPNSSFFDLGQELGLFDGFDRLL